MNIRLNDLENFLAVASCRTLSEGAQKRGITQPSLSESIRRLERDLACVVFYRSKDGIRLTPSGRLILDRGRKAAEALLELSSLGLGQGQDQGPDSDLFQGRSLTIGCHHAVAAYTLPAALAQLHVLAPDFRVSLVHDFSRIIQAQIQSGRIDVGVIVNPTPVPDLVIKRLATDTVAVWAARRGAIPDRLICDPDLFQAQAIMRRWRACPRDIVSSTSLELIARLVDRGIGYGILPARVVELLGVKLRRVRSAPTYKDELAVVHRPEFGRLPYERSVLTALRGALG
jgi:DNA-binding transcriptional LysR family regulator